MRVARRKLIAIAATVAAVAVLLGVLHFVFPSPEARLRRDLNLMARACESGSADQIGPFVSARYRGTAGTDKAEAMALAGKALGTMRELKISIGTSDIRVEGDTARAVVIYTSSGKVMLGESQSYVPFRNLTSRNPLKSESVYAEFREADGRWLLEYITWDVAPQLGDFPKAKKELGK